MVGVAYESSGHNGSSLFLIQNMVTAETWPDFFIPEEIRPDEILENTKQFTPCPEPYGHPF